MKIDLHVHTDHSFDCEMSVNSLVEIAESVGMNAIAITDHDTMSACEAARKLAREVVIIPGMEITCRGGTHIIGLFLKDDIVSSDILDTINEIHEQGGLVLIPHLFRPDTGLLFNKETKNQFDGEEILKILSRVDLIEAINSGCKLDDILNTDKFLSFHPDIPRTAGSDAHLPDDIGKAYVELEEIKSNSLNDIREALLHSPRTIRYEAYDAEAEWEMPTAKIQVRKGSLDFKKRSLLPSYIKRSIQTIYRKSAGKLIDARSRKGKENVK